MSTIRRALYTTFAAKYSAHRRIELCQISALPNPEQFYLKYPCRFYLKYLIKRISAAVGDISTIRYAFSSTVAAKYSAHYPVIVILTLVHVKILCNCSFAYVCLSIPLNLSRLLLVTCRKVDARCSSPLLPNTAQIGQIFLCYISVLSNAAYLLYSRFCLKYLIESTIAAILYIKATRCAPYSTFAAKYSRNAPVYIMSTRVDVKSNVIADLHS